MELVNIVTPNKLKNIQTLGASNSQADKLYWLVQKGIVENDEDALAQLYPESKTKKSLYQLKERLYFKLIDSVIIIDSEDKNLSSYSIARQNCLKYCTAFEKIALKGGGTASIELGEKILKIALPYNMCRIIIRVARVLMSKAIFVLNDVQKMECYRSLYVKYSAIEELQELAKYYWIKIAAATSQKRMVIDEGLIVNAKNYVKELESKLITDHTAITYTYLFSLKILVEELNHNHAKVVELVDECLLAIQNYKDVHNAFFTIFLNKKLVALVTLRQFKEARIASLETLKYIREGDTPWFTAYESIFILHLYQAEYIEALKVYKKIISNKKLKFLPPDRQEIFKVYRAYLQFFINFGILPIDDDDKDYKVYRSSKFANEVPIFSKDKIGMNISIMVAQFLMLFTEEKYQETIDKIDYIKQYSKANLRKGQTYRAHCFLKMIVKMIECNYHKAATIRKTKTLYGKLKNQPADLLRQTSHVEIVPYEVLWDILLGSIDNSFRGKVKAKQK